jgi:hypothetical protein
MTIDLRLGSATFVPLNAGISRGGTPEEAERRRLQALARQLTLLEMIIERVRNALSP